jgi:hypothetical protein
MSHRERNRRDNFSLYAGSAAPCQLKTDTEDGSYPFNNPPKRISGILSLRGSLRQARSRKSLGFM